MKNKAKNNTRSISDVSQLTQSFMKNINKDKGEIQRVEEVNGKKTLARELFSALSLTSQEEHELLQFLFISALKKSFQAGNDNDKDISSLSEQIVLQSNNKDIQAGLAKAEEKIGRALHGSVDSDNDEDEDEAAGDKSSFPNLKYAQPKYKNIESILKYNETPDDKGGVKLVIMNFND